MQFKFLKTDEPSPKTSAATDTTFYIELKKDAKTIQFFYWQFYAKKNILPMKENIKLPNFAG